MVTVSPIPTSRSEARLLPRITAGKLTLRSAPSDPTLIGCRVPSAARAPGVRLWESSAKTGFFGATTPRITAPDFT